jgi:hypothetical protein
VQVAEPVATVLAAIRPYASDFGPFRLLLISVAGWLGQQHCDAIDYTISPAALKEIPRRLLALNHARAEAEAAAAPSKPQRRNRKAADSGERASTDDLFSQEA